MVSADAQIDSVDADAAAGGDGSVQLGLKRSRVAARLPVGAKGGGAGHAWGDAAGTAAGAVEGCVAIGEDLDGIGQSGWLMHVQLCTRTNSDDSTTLAGGFTVHVHRAVAQLLL
jgi:hypothetical protein